MFPFVRGFSNVLSIVILLLMFIIYYWLNNKLVTSLSSGGKITQEEVDSVKIFSKLLII